MGSFVEQNLNTGEKIFYKGEIHWMVYFESALWLAVACVMYYYGRYSWHLNLMMVNISTIAILAIAVTKFAKAFIHRHFTEMVLTDQRLVAKFGFISREAIELPLAKIESVFIDQTISERMIGAGSVAVRGTGSAIAPIRFIDNPMEFRNKINEAIARLRAND